MNELDMEGDTAAPPKGSFPSADLRQCGQLPRLQGSRLTLEHFLGLVEGGSGRSAEATYLQGYASRHGRIFSADACVDAVPLLAEDNPDNDLHLSPQVVIEWAKSQHHFFEALDACELDLDAVAPLSTAASATSAAPGTWKSRLDAATLALPPVVVPSESIVLEAAFHLLGCGILAVPDTQTVNVKAARALLMIAMWLQRLMWEKWCETGAVLASFSGGPR